MSGVHYSRAHLSSMCKCWRGCLKTLIRPVATTSTQQALPSQPASKHSASAAAHAVPLTACHSTSVALRSCKLYSTASACSCCVTSCILHHASTPVTSAATQPIACAASLSLARFICFQTRRSFRCALRRSCWTTQRQQRSLRQMPLHAQRSCTRPSTEVRSTCT